MGKSKCSLNCGSCLFLEKERTFETPCIAQGRLPTSKACGSYKPNAYLLVGNTLKNDRVEKLADAIHGMTATELQALGALMHAERTTRKYGWRFHQKVYVRIAGSSDRNYLNNFVSGRVLFADKETVRVIGENGKTCLTLINEKTGTTLYTVERFNEIRAQMLEANKRKDPVKMSQVRPVVQDLDHIPEEKITNKAVRRDRSRDDLVSIVSRMQRGVVARPERRRKKKTGGGGEIKMNW